MGANRTVDDIHLERLQAGLYACGAQLLQKALVQSPVRFEVALLDRVIDDEVVAQLVGVGFFLFERGVGLVFVGLGDEVIFLGLDEKTALFGMNVPGQLIDLRLLRPDLGIVRPQRAVDSLGVVRLGLGQIGAQPIEQRLRLAGCGVERAFDGIRVHAVQHAVARFSEDARQLGLRGGARQIVERTHDALVVRGVEAQRRAQLPLQVHHLFLRGLDELLQVVELTDEILRDVLRGVEAGLIAAVDVVVDELVDDGGGQLGIQTAVADPHDVGFGNQSDLEVGFERLHDVLASYRIFHRLMFSRRLAAEEVGVVSQD